MIIVGVSDGIDAGAALVVDDEVVAVESQQTWDRVPRSRAFPWAAIDAVLAEGGLQPRDVDLIAVAGRFTPPLFLRRRPGLRRVARDAFSPALDANVFFQAMLRQSGFGAMEADRAAEWLEGRFKERGFGHRRVVLVDIHKCLADAAYRTQTVDPALALTLHPMGDGVAAAVQRCSAGQLDRLWEQRGFSSLHVHLQRCLNAVGLEALEDARLWGAAGRGTPDPELVDLLRSSLRAEGPRMSRKRYPLPERRAAMAYDELARAERTVAAASVLENLRETVLEWVANRQADAAELLLGGQIFDNPRLVADVLATGDVGSMSVAPSCGYAGLALGAAIGVAGMHGRVLAADLGRDFEQRIVQRVIDAAGVDSRAVDASVVAGLLAQGHIVGVFAGRGSLAAQGGGARSVLFRPDDASVAAARGRLGLTHDDEPVAAILADDASELIVDEARYRECARWGRVAPRASDRLREACPGVVAADGRVHYMRVERDSALGDVLAAMSAASSPGVLGMFGLASPGEPIVGQPGDAIRAWRRGACEHLWLGDLLVHAG